MNELYKYTSRNYFAEKIQKSLNRKTASRPRMTHFFIYFLKLKIKVVKYLNLIRGIAFFVYTLNITNEKRYSKIF